MDSDIRFSVVLPAYNEERNLENAVESVLHQTYGNFELIIVDNGSKDKTGKIAEHFKSLYSDVRLITNEANQGRAAARNEGLKAADGDYVIMLDPDDRFECDLLERVRDAINKEPADIVCYSYSEQFLSKRGMVLYTKIHRLPEIYDTGETDFKKTVKTMLSCNAAGHVWNKAYRLGWLREKKIQFQDVSQIDGMLFDVDTLSSQPAVVTLPDELYHCRNVRGDKRTGEYLPDYIDLHKKGIERLKNLLIALSIYDDDTIKVLAHMYIRVLSSGTQREMSHGMSKNDAAQLLENESHLLLYRELADKFVPESRADRVLRSLIAEGNMRGAAATTKWLIRFGKVFPDLLLRFLR